MKRRTQSMSLPLDFDYHALLKRAEPEPDEPSPDPPPAEDLNPEVAAMLDRFAAQHDAGQVAVRTTGRRYARCPTTPRHVWESLAENDPIIRAELAALWTPGPIREGSDHDQGGPTIQRRREPGDDPEASGAQASADDVAICRAVGCDGRCGSADLATEARPIPLSRRQSRPSDDRWTKFNAIDDLTTPSGE